MTNSYTTPGPAGGAGQVLPDRKGIPRATSFFGCIFLKQVRRGRVPLSRAQARQHDAARAAWRGCSCVACDPLTLRSTGLAWSSCLSEQGVMRIWFA
jgi:hypothetical protein